MGKLKEKMRNDMRIRGFSERTEMAYLSTAEKFIKYCNKSPEKITIDEINRFQYYLKNQTNYSWAYFNQYVCSIRFLYNVTLKRNWMIEHIPFHKKSKYLPDVLSKEEIGKMYKEIINLRDKAIFLTLYSTGVRISELLNIRIKNINRNRMQIFIKEGKGMKDRYVNMSHKLLIILEKYWLSQKVKSYKYLFPGMKIDKSISARVVQKMISDLGNKTGILKRVYPHLLRHSYATHLLESGVDIRRIQVLLGHSSLRTTSKYLHIAQNYLQSVESPIEEMDSIEGHINEKKKYKI